MSDVLLLEKMDDLFFGGLLFSVVFDFQAKLWAHGLNHEDHC
tara:strand:- start:134 stop:259 length:126 start_codon:yes stop_codon:yes gene_type:complete